MIAPTVRFSIGSEAASFAIGGQQPWLVPYPDERPAAARVLSRVDLRAVETAAWERWSLCVELLPSWRLRFVSGAAPGSPTACGVGDWLTNLADVEAAKRIAFEEYFERHVAQPSRRMR